MQENRSDQHGPVGRTDPKARPARYVRRWRIRCRGMTRARRGRRMPRMTRIALPISTLVLALAGCGGDEKSNRDASYKPPATTTAAASRNAEQQDAEAKANARRLVSEVEVCFVDNAAYTGCEKPPGTKLPLGSGPGQVEVTKAATATYTAVAHSESGANFTIAKGSDGSVERSCDKPGAGGCNGDGGW